VGSWGYVSIDIEIMVDDTNYMIFVSLGKSSTIVSIVIIQKLWFIQKLWLMNCLWVYTIEHWNVCRAKMAFKNNLKIGDVMGYKTNKLCFVGQTWPDRLG
jgi:hypothetical protein